MVTLRPFSSFLFHVIVYFNIREASHWTKEVKQVTLKLTKYKMIIKFYWNVSNPQRESQCSLNQGSLGIIAIITVYDIQ